MTVLTASVAALSLVSCGSGTGGDETRAIPTKGNDITVGLLLPETANTRYDKFDYPIIKAKVAELTDGRGKVQYANAGADADKQNRQLDEMIANQVDVLLVDAVDSKAIAGGVEKARDAGIPVIAYDRLAEGPIDAYISFDNELVGQVQGRALTEELGDSSSIKVVMMNGAVTDPNAAQFKAGALHELEGKVTIAATYDTKNWDPANARSNMEQSIAKIGLDKIDGVYAANDGIAGAVIEAFKTAGLTKIPPVTGQDAELAAVQRIIAGEQFMSVYKSYPQEANTAAEMAVAHIQGRSIEFDALTRNKVNSSTHEKIPAQLVPVVALTKENVQDVIDDGIYTLKQICTPKYRAACQELGLKQT